MQRKRHRRCRKLVFKLFKYFLLLLGSSLHSLSRFAKPSVIWPLLSLLTISTFELLTPVKLTDFYCSKHIVLCLMGRPLYLQFSTSGTLLPPYPRWFNLGVVSFSAWYIVKISNIGWIGEWINEWTDEWQRERLVMKVTHTLSSPSGIAFWVAETRATEDNEGRDMGRQTEGLEELQQWIRDERKRPKHLEDVIYTRTCWTLCNNP